MQLHQVISGMRSVVWYALKWVSIGVMLILLGALIGMLAGCAAEPVGYDMY